MCPYPSRPASLCVCLINILRTSIMHVVISTCLQLARGFLSMLLLLAVQHVRPCPRVSRRNSKVRPRTREGVGGLGRRRPTRGQRETAHYGRGCQGVQGGPGKQRRKTRRDQKTPTRRRESKYRKSRRERARFARFRAVCLPHCRLLECF